MLKKIFVILSITWIGSIASMHDHGGGMGSGEHHMCADDMEKIRILSIADFN